MSSCCPWQRPKELLVSVAMPPARVWVPSQRSLAPSVASVTNDKGDNEMIPGAVLFHLPYSWGKPQKTSARRPSDEGAVRPVITSNGVPFLQMRSVGLHSTSGREKEGIKEKTICDIDHLVGPWVSMSKYWSRGRKFNRCTSIIFNVDYLERGPCSLVRTIG